MDPSTQNSKKYTLLKWGRLKFYKSEILNMKTLKELVATFLPSSNDQQATILHRNHAQESGR